MGGNPGLDNGEWMMRAYREATQQALNQYNQQALNQYNNSYPSLTPQAWTNPPTPGERPEPEDTTGLKMLEEFLARRKGERDGDGDERK
jgi:hypothetical protein